MLKAKFILGVLFVLILNFACQRIEQLQIGSSSRLIKQSNQIVIDNVNGRLSAPDGVIQSVNFFYNENNTLNSATVYDDTSINATLLKSVAFEYQTDKVIANTYEVNVGSSTVQFFYNNKNQVTQIVDLNGNGLTFTYSNDLITQIIDSSINGIIVFTDFIYDDNNNLLQHDLDINNGTVLGRVVLTYSNNSIPQELDTRLFTAGVRFLYIGGLDLITKVGLNFGKTNTHTLIKREEINLTTNEIVETYNFGYTYDEQNRIIKRNMRWSTDTLFYQFKY